MNAAPPRAPGDGVRVAVFVDAPPAIAFEVFTAQIDLWWRRGLKFRASGAAADVLHLEPRLGGRLFETVAADGGEPHVIQTGEVTEWAPPHALAIAWRGTNYAPDERTTIRVRFEPRGAGTQVTLEHTGFAALRPDHPVRHGEAVAVFVRRTAMWWSEQLTSLRERVARLAAASAGPAPRDGGGLADAPWMAVARAELGVRAGPPGAANPRITAYHAHTNIAGYDDRASWCSSFVDWTLRRVGLAGTGSALARSWLDWGRPLDAPRPGCIVVLWRDDPASWKGHVGFFVRVAGAEIVLLGGNQREQEVCEHAYPLATVLGYRWPLDPRWPGDA